MYWFICVVICLKSKLINNLADKKCKMYIFTGIATECDKAVLHEGVEPVDSDQRFDQTG